jgi:uncharacterized protein YndB with AHSA1/START domain
MNATRSLPFAVAAFGLLSLAGCGPSLPELDRLAAQGRVQPSAAVHAHHEVLVGAPPVAVWAVLTDVHGWPSWHLPVKRADAQGPLASGTTFTWNNNGTDIRSTVAAARPPALLAWTGSASVAKAVHVWRLSPAQGAAATRVDVEETMDGPLLSWLYPQTKLDADVVRWLADLKAEVERREGGR